MNPRRKFSRLEKAVMNFDLTSQLLQNMPVARGYCRVSTAMQADDGVSLDTQQKRIKEYCNFKQLNLVKLYEDAGLSAKNTDRPALQELMKEMKEGDTVIVCDLSRLSRRTSDALQLFEDFKKRGVNFVCLSPNIEFSTPVGALMFSVLMAVHQLERENISSHVKANMNQLAKEGKLRSRPPFGYKFVGKDQDLQPEPLQQKVVEKIKALHAEGLGYTKIANKLNDEGDNICLNNNKKSVKNKTPVFYAQTVKRILADYGVIEDPDRIPIERRIVSHRKTGESSSSTA